ncbi:MAG: putative rane protein [Mycobacterium sp.]|nr:putative rane protein [Mycobacterium sp.]
MLSAISLGTDFKRYLHGTMPRLALGTIIVLPLLYGALYLWAFWDPFGHVSKMPVALVDEDRGAIAQGQELRAGDQVAAALLGSGQLNLRQVSAEEAAEGVSHGTYYFSITLPADFSAAVASPSGDHPHQAQIRFTFNDANSYLASVIGQNAAREILNQVNAKVGEQVVGKVLISVTDAAAGIKRAADGAGQLAAGLTSANSGAHQLADGSRTLADNLAKARDGSVALAAGTHQLSSAVATATDPLLTVLDGVDSLNVDPAEVADTAAHVSSGVKTATDRIAALDIDHRQAAAIIDAVVAGLRNNADPAVRDLGDTLTGAQRTLTAHGMDQSTEEGLARLGETAQHLDDELSDPSSSLRTLLTRTFNGQLRSDVIELRNGATDLDTGASNLSAGLVALTNGGYRLTDGATTLAAGTQQLQGGAEQLAAGLHQGAAQIPSWNDQQRAAVSRTIANPVGAGLGFTHRAATFGTGFAPFFLPLALFIGALIIWMLLSALQTRAILDGLGALRVVLASYWGALLVAVCQVLVMYAVVHFGVGLTAKHPIGTVAFLSLIAATFVALIQVFNAVFGVAVGRVIALAFLMLQLVSSGGIYPVETTAKPFRILHPFDPMTYAVNGLRELTVGGIDSRLWLAIAVLLTLLCASLGASTWAARRNRQFTMNRLDPPIRA